MVCEKANIHKFHNLCEIRRLLAARMAMMGVLRRDGKRFGSLLAPFISSSSINGTNTHLLIPNLRGIQSKADISHGLWNPFTSLSAHIPHIRLPSATGIGSSTHFFSEDAHLSHMPIITDPDIENVFKDLMASSWDELPDPVIKDAKKALSKNTQDRAGQEALENVFRAAEACEEFGGILVQLRMSIDDSIGLSGENVKPLSDEFATAMREVYKRYTAYLDAFGPDETYLRKKVETELGTKMIHLKMRCSSLGSEWGKVTVLGTSGLSGSYVEQRAP